MLLLLLEKDIYVGGQNLSHGVHPLFAAYHLMYSEKKIHGKNGISLVFGLLPAGY